MTNLTRKELEHAVHHEVSQAANKQINASYAGDVNPVDTFINTKNIMQLIETYTQAKVTQAELRAVESQTMKVIGKTEKYMQKKVLEARIDELMGASDMQYMMRRADRIAYCSSRISQLTNDIGILERSKL